MVRPVTRQPAERCPRFFALRAAVPLMMPLMRLAGTARSRANAVMLGMVDEGRGLRHAALSLGAACDPPPAAADSTRGVVLLRVVAGYLRPDLGHGNLDL